MQVEYVKQEAKILYLLECLQKTAPPVLIFAENKADVDDIHEYLLLKGVEAVAIHGGKSQEERDEAIDLFKAGRKDVLVATDVASKGLDFPDIQHVVNYDMPEEIEVGRVARIIPEEQANRSNTLRKRISVRSFLLIPARPQPWIAKHERLPIDRTTCTASAARGGAARRGSPQPSSTRTRARRRCWT